MQAPEEGAGTQTRNNGGGYQASSRDHWLWLQPTQVTAGQQKALSRTKSNTRRSLGGAELLQHGGHGGALGGLLGGAQQGDASELCSLGPREPAAKARVHEVVQPSPGLGGSAKPEVCRHGATPRQDLEHHHAERVHVALVGGPPRRRVLRGQVTHGRAVLERREHHVVGQELVHAGAGEVGDEQVVDQDLVCGDALVHESGLVWLAAVEVVDA